MYRCGETYSHLMSSSLVSFETLHHDIEQECATTLDGGRPNSNPSPNGSASTPSTSRDQQEGRRCRANGYARVAYHYQLHELAC